MDLERFTRPAGESFDLAAFDTDDTGRFEGKKEIGELLEDNRQRLHLLQRKFYADGRHALLIVLQGMDTGGKDGTIRHVMGAFDPQGVVVTPFKVPTEEELAHDFLWRVHRAVPRRSMVGIFNRSHYEDVLVVRVKNLVPEAVWSRRYEEINDFERLLAANGVAIVKIFLHISPEEQAERLRDRQQDPDKQWKFNPGDLADRALWPQFMAAYADALSRCNTAGAPWYVVPADKKWYRNLVVSEILLATLEGLDLAFPQQVENIDSYEIPPVDWP